MNDKLLNILGTETNIKTFQITVDGYEEQHNKTRVLKNGTGTFKSIITNIKNCLDMDPKNNIIIRYNINKMNQDIEPLLQYLKENGLKNNKVKLHFNEAKRHPISYTDEDIFFENLKQYADSLLLVYKKLAKYNYSIPTYAVRATNCEHDCINNFLIETNGKMYQCSSSDGEDIFNLGSIVSNGTIQYNHNLLNKKMLREPFDKKECLNCKVLPMCMGGCFYEDQLGHEPCIPEKYIIQDLVKLYYESALSND